MGKTLTHPFLGDREFNDEHAARLLAMSNNGGWKLKEYAARSNDVKTKAGKEAPKVEDKSSE